MKARSAIAVIVGALAFAGQAGAARDQHLSFHAARAAAAKSTRPDRPTRIAIHACRRRSAAQIRCRVTEYGVRSYWSSDGHAIVMTLVSANTVTRRRDGRITDRNQVLWFSGS